MKVTSQKQKPTQILNTKPLFPMSNLWKIAFLILFGFALIGSVLGTYLLIKKGETKITSPSTKLSNAINQKELLVVNSHSSIQDERGSYFTFQVKYPSEYLVTSDDMVTSYVSQGGMAPPRLIFTKDTQPLGEYTYWDIWSSNGDCILVWSTSGWDSIEDFQTHGNASEPPQTISQEQVTISGNYQADKRIVKYSDRQSNNLEAFVQLPETVAYFFQTCNMNSEEDLEILLSNFKVRANETYDAIGKASENSADVELEEIENVKKLVNNFETAIKEKNVADVMNYFTPPKNDEEEKIYNSIITGPSGPRLFNNVASRFEVQSWKIARREYPDNNELISKEGEKYFVVVEEVRRSWDPVAGDYSPWSSGFYVMEIVKSDDGLLIDKYYWQQASLREEMSSLKYLGLGF